MPSWPDDNDWEGISKGRGGGSAGPDSRDVKDTLAGTGQSLPASFRSPVSSTCPRSSKGIQEKLGLLKENKTQ